jgi:hypothetical protein
MEIYCIKTIAVMTVFIFQLDPKTVDIIFLSPFKQESICGNQLEPDEGTPTLHIETRHHDLTSASSCAVSSPYLGHTFR